jgi:hypothetical protein
MNKKTKVKLLVLFTGMFITLAVLTFPGIHVLPVGFMFFGLFLAPFMGLWAAQLIN